tara:strand:+ start:1225 stop:1407 length:183 start_codon:yes stop_codon:yes gene_type:complete
LLEKYFQCPHCWQEQLKLIDPSEKNQNFIEDCEICCNPIDFEILINYNEIVDFQIKKTGQ